MSCLFSYKLRLERTLEFTPGKASVMIHDRVRNMGGSPAPLMILYHCNFGWPLVSPDSEVIGPSKVIEPRDEAAKPGINTWHQLQKPVPDYAEQVFFHEIKPSKELATASIVNKKLNVGVNVNFDSRTLTYLTEWKQMGFRDYTVGIEPGNCLPEGRVSARNGGRLCMLQPDETEEFRIGFEVFHP
jgi:hypothetical protein